MVLNENYVPDLWKHGNIMPVHKKGPRNIKENYRPISLTCVLCKLFERILKENILDFLLNNGLNNIGYIIDKQQKQQGPYYTSLGNAAGAFHVKCKQ